MTDSTGTPRTPGASGRGAWPFAPVNSEPPANGEPPVDRESPTSPLPQPAYWTPSSASPTRPPTSPAQPLVPPESPTRPLTSPTSPSTSPTPPPPRRSVTLGAPPTPPSEDPPVEDEPRRRRPPLWLLIVLGVAVLGAIAAVVLILTRPEAEVLDPEVITLPIPTPTVEPIERAPGTPFFESLPSEVLDFVLAEYDEWEEPLLASGLEGYYLAYSDGATTVTLYAGQWRDAAGAEAAFDKAVAAAAEVPAEEPTEEPTEDVTEGDTEDDAAEGDETAAPAAESEEGVVEVDGEQVGRYLLMPRADGTASLWWTNQTVLLQLDGPLEELRDLFTAFPL